MKTIEIDEEVYATLARRAVGFGQTPNGVLRNLLNLGEVAKGRPTDFLEKSPVASFNSGLSGLVQDQGYTSLNHVGRFLAILSWLCKESPARVRDLLDLNRGGRPYFSDSKERLKKAVPYAQVRQVPGTEVWAMVTIENKTKRKILAELLDRYGHPREVVDRVLATLPSGERMPVDVKELVARSEPQNV